MRQKRTPITSAQQYVFIVRWSYVEHCCAFSTLEEAKQCANNGEDRTLLWDEFGTDMRDVVMWYSNKYRLFGETDEGTGQVVITKYPLGIHPGALT